MQAILFSSRYKVALVDGRIVRLGITSAPGLVRPAIEQNSVVSCDATARRGAWFWMEPAIKGAGT